MYTVQLNGRFIEAWDAEGVSVTERGRRHQFTLVELGKLLTTWAWSWENIKAEVLIDSV